VHRFGGYVVRGRKPEVRQYLLESAKSLEDAGCFSIVLESIPSILGKEITQNVQIPTIGIGAGSDCDGQVLVIYDMLGFYKNFLPKYVRHYENLANVIEKAVRSFKSDVRNGEFPSETESYS